MSRRAVGTSFTGQQSSTEQGLQQGAGSRQRLGMASTWTLTASLSSSCLLGTHVFLCPEWRMVWKSGKGSRFTSTKNIVSVVFWWRVVRTEIPIHSGCFTVVHALFKATTLYLELLRRPTPLKREGNGEGKSSVGFIFHFHFYIKVLRPQWKKVSTFVNKPACELHTFSFHLQQHSHVNNDYSIMPKDIGHTVKRTKPRNTMIQLR